MRALFFGDSICAGSNIPGGGPADAWPRLWAAGTGGAWEAIDASRGGRPTASLDEFATALAAHPGCDLLVLGLGTNDSRDLAADMVPRAVANLRAMIAAARSAGIARILVLGPCNIRVDALEATRAIGPQRAGNIVALNQAYAVMSAAERVGFLSLHGAIPEGLLARDGVHPDRAGNEAIARRFAAHMAAG